MTDDELKEFSRAKKGVPVYLLHLRFTGGSDATVSNINHALGAARFPGEPRENIGYCHIECEGCEWRREGRGATDDIECEGCDGEEG